MTTPGTFWKLARFGSMKLNLLLGTLFVLLIVFSIITLVLYGVYRRFGKAELSLG